MSYSSKDFSWRDIVALESKPKKRDEGHLPPEVICIIISHVKLERNSQSALHSCCLVSRSWYSVAVVQLYHSPILKGEKCLLFVGSICDSKDAHIFKSSISQYVVNLDLSDLSHKVQQNVTEEILAKVEGRLEALVAPVKRFSIDSLTAISKCHKLVRLDISLVHVSFHVLDLLRAVSVLSCLKIFHFPQEPPAFPGSDSDMSDYERSETIPEWPDNVEAFHVPTRLDRGYLPAFAKAPASLSTLIIEDGVEIFNATLDKVLHLLAPQILTLRVEFESEASNFDSESSYLLDDILSICSNLLHISVRPLLAESRAIWRLDPEIDHPLRSITIILDQANDILDLDFLHYFEDLLEDNAIPNVRRLLLSVKSGKDHWASSLLENVLPTLDLQLLDISSCLKRRSSSASDLEQCGVWLVDGGDSDAIICEFTVETFAKIGSKNVVLYILRHGKT